MYQNGEIADVGTVFTVVLSVTLGATSVFLIMPTTQAITNASSAASELFSIIDKPSLLDPLSTAGKTPAECNGVIEIRDLSFAYPARPTAPVLQKMNLSIPAGKTTALVGPSGCGKSTLVGLLERWYSPTSGQITLDGNDLTDCNINWLRSNIRLVQQEPTLFTGTVFQNVVKGLVGPQSNLPEEKQIELVKEACIAAGAHEFVEKLPNGYHTQLGESARMLSGGQRQRVSIARSIISDPKILLFDEATSALDPRAEKVVQEALNRVSINKTTLIIAHKLATVMAADNIAVMANGRVIEQGTHRDLLELDGLYAAMVRAQDLDTDDKPKELEQNEGDKAALSAIQLRRTQSVVHADNPKSDIEHLTVGTLDYPLFKCILLMLKEHSDLYGWYAIISVVCILLGGTYPAQAILFSRLIETFILPGAEARQQADFYSLMFFVLALGNLVGYFCLGIATNTIGQSITHRYRREMVERILHFDQDFFDCPENSSGALTSQLSSAPSALQELMSANLGLIVNVTVNIISSSVLGIAYGWKLGLTLVFAGLPIIVAGGYIRIRLDQKLELLTERQYATSAGLATESVSSIKTVSSLTLEKPILKEYEQTLDGIVSIVIRNFVSCLGRSNSSG